jgi:hypothetical protein
MAEAKKMAVEAKKSFEATIQTAVSSANILRRESTDPRVKSLAQVFALVCNVNASLERQIESADKAFEAADALVAELQDVITKLEALQNRDAVVAGLTNLSGTV